MTRRSKREIDHALDELDDPEQFTLQAYLLADLKGYYGGDLSRGERRLLENPEAHLPTSAVRRLGNLGGSQ
ncbi:hypothetical protein [Halarchaeum nitratireducens]|uniref:Uncharacterized protein n=1 Tax=Halarchaeum nitratireducens TaxID=489913 RepID=A0A830GH69_9EURY|nr:hypothetical protein [Halarchaeum nitratireducens]GGN26912.1 hypothetical protein GCM10009021_31750 [Halarchaeum nitratireducens]